MFDENDCAELIHSTHWTQIVLSNCSKIINIRCSIRFQASPSYTNHRYYYPRGVSLATKPIPSRRMQPFRISPYARVILMSLIATYSPLALLIWSGRPFSRELSITQIVKRAEDSWLIKFSVNQFAGGSTFPCIATDIVGAVYQTRRRCPDIMRKLLNRRHFTHLRKIDAANLSNASSEFTRMYKDPLTLFYHWDSQ